jgi:spore germination protein KC
MEKRPSWYHAKYVIIGEEAAKTDVDRLFSFFMEDDETKLLYRIAVVKGMSAKEFLQQANTGKDSLADYLDTLFSAVNETGKSRELHLINYATQRDTPWVSFYMPVLELYKNPSLSGDKQSDGGGGGSEGEQSSERKNLVALNGFARFNEHTIAGFIAGDISRGLNIITNNIRHSGLSVKDQQGNNVGLEIKKCSSHITPCFDPLSATISVSFECNLVEFQTVNPQSETDIKYIEQKQNELICGEVAQAVKLMQELKSDPAFIMDAFYHNDPVKWQSIKDDWANVFSNLKVTIEVNSKVLNTFEFIKPIGK